MADDSHCRSTVLFSLDSLIEIHRTYHIDYPSISADYDISPSMPSLRLTKLYIVSSISDAIPLLSHLPSLKELSIFGPLDRNQLIAPALNHGCLGMCCSLKKLEIEGIPENWDFDMVTAEQKTSCTDDGAAIFALGKLSKLESFWINWPYPLNIREDDLAQLLPKLKVLSLFYLNCAHIVLDGDVDFALPLSILPKIAIWCPSIRNLGLFLNCTDVTVDADLTDITPPSMILTNLNLGFSRIDNFILVDWRIIRLIFAVTTACLRRQEMNGRRMSSFKRN